MNRIIFAPNFKELWGIACEGCHSIEIFLLDSSCSTYPAIYFNVILRNWTGTAHKEQLNADEEHMLFHVTLIPKTLLIHIESLQHLLVRLRCIHLQVREKFAPLCDHSKEPAACGVIFLVFLQVLGDLRNTLGDDTDLHLRGTGVLFVSLKLSDDLGLRGFLESHKWGCRRKKRSVRASLGRSPPEKHGSREIVLGKSEMSRLRALRA